MEGGILNHWITREVPRPCYLDWNQGSEEQETEVTAKWTEDGAPGGACLMFVLMESVNMSLGLSLLLSIGSNIRDTWFVLDPQD